MPVRPLIHSFHEIYYLLLLHLKILYIYLYNIYIILVFGTYFHILTSEDGLFFN